VRNCFTDEGRPLGTGLQEQVPNHLRRLWSKARVVSTGGKGLERTRSGGWQEEDCEGTTDDVSKAKGRCQNRRGIVTAGSAPAGPVYGRSGIRHEGGLSLLRGGRAERGNLGLRCKRRSRKWKNHEGESTEAEPRGGATCSSDEVPDKRMERRGCVMEPDSMSQPAMGGADE
jgi:hypothetical protein